MGACPGAGQMESPLKLGKEKELLQFVKEQQDREREKTEGREAKQLENEEREKERAEREAQRQHEMAEREAQRQHELQIRETELRSADLVMQCLDDKVESIRLRALDLISGMVTKKNLMEIGKKLLAQIEEADSQSYSNEILSTLIQICSHSNYQFVTNFEWYLDVLVQLSRVEGTRHGRLIAAQMMDVAIRVKAIRPYAVQSLSLVLDCNHLFTDSMVQKNGACQVLNAAAWVSGEFCDLLPDVEFSLDAILKLKVTSLPSHIQDVFVQSICKLYSSLMNNAEKERDDAAAKEFGQQLIERLPMFVQSADLEVQERASCILRLIKYVVKLQGKGVACGDEVVALFSGEQNPVAPKAQKKVPVPDGPDLEKWINYPPSESSEGEQDLDAMFMDTEETIHRNLKQKDPEEDEEELARRREQRRQ